MAERSAIAEVRGDINAELALIAEGGDRHSIDRLIAEVEANPGYPDRRYRLAHRLTHAGRLSEALEQLDAALAVNPRFVDALELKVRILSDRGELREAIGICRQMNSVNPRSASGLLAEAVLHARLGDHAAAIGAARGAMDAGRGSVDAQVLLGEQYLSLGDYRLARRHLEAACRVRPSEDQHYLVALICLKQEDAPSAEQHLRRALELNPRHLNAIVRLSVLKIDEGDFTEAHRLLSEAVSAYPTYPDLHYGLARVCLLMGKRDDAYRLMKVALELNPRYAAARKEIAFLCNDDDHEQAVDHAQKVVEVDPGDVQATIDLGHIYDRQGDPERAIEVLEAATERFPESWKLYQALGLVNLQRKAFSKARLAFDAATRINPELESVERSLRVVFQDESLFDDERQRLLAKFPNPGDQPILNHHLGRIHLEFNKENLAAQYFRQSFEAGHAPARNAVMLATLYANRGDNVSAIRWLESVSGPGMANLARRQLLGLFHASAGEYETSTRFYQQVMTEAPLFFRSLDGLSVCFREREELEDMLDDYLDYARYNEKNAPLFRRIGIAFANKGMLVDARRHFEHATILDPNDGSSFHALGVLTMLRLDFDDALGYFRTAAERRPEWALPHLSLALGHIERGDRFQASLAFQRYVFLEPEDCWREPAEKIARELSTHPKA